MNKHFLILAVLALVAVSYTPVSVHAQDVEVEVIQTEKETETITTITEDGADAADEVFNEDIECSNAAVAGDNAIKCESQEDGLVEYEAEDNAEDKTE